MKLFGFGAPIFPSLFVIAMLLTTHGGEANLLEKWKLDNPTATFASETNTFLLKYDIHESIDVHNVRAKIYTAKCQNPTDGSKAVEVSDGIRMETVGASDGKGTLEFSLDVTRLSGDPRVFDEANPSRPAIKLCARYMLYTPDGSMEVNFVESLLTVRFDLQDQDLAYSAMVAQQFDSTGASIS